MGAAFKARLCITGGFRTAGVLNEKQDGTVTCKKSSQIVKVV